MYKYNLAFLSLFNNFILKICVNPDNLRHLRAKKQIMKRIILLLCILLPVYLQAQNNQNFDKSFEEFQKSINQQFNTFQDSINAAFAKTLEQQWQEFQVFAKIPAPVKPNPPAPPVADTPKEELPPPVEIPVKEIEPPQEEKPQEKKTEPQEPRLDDKKPELPKIEEETKPVAPVFPDVTPSVPYHKTINLWNSAFKIPHDLALENLFLTNTQEKTVADFWRSLSRTNYQPAVNAIVEMKNKHALNQYGLALLCQEYAKSVWANKPQNETAVFLVFLLNQLGLDAKIVRTSNRLEPVIHSPQNVYATSYLEMDRKPYYFLFSTLEPTSIFTYKTNFSDKITGLDFNVYKPVNLNAILIDKELWVKKLNQTVTLTYSQSAIDYYRNYPQVDADVNANAAVNEHFINSVIRQFKPLLAGKTEEEAVNILLNFMHYAFEYMDDIAHYGYEKWNFCEENLYYPYNDCDDRAIMFSYLVRLLLDLDVVLVLYSDHMSAAVHFNTPVSGNYFTIGGKKYVICDPTYIGSTAGMNPPKYKNEEVEIVRTKRL